MKIDLLDHGFVKFIDKMGDDYRVIQSARVSTGNQAKTTKEKDRGLIRYLYRNEHLTPFESVVLTFHVKCPIFVGRQWMRHRTFCIEGSQKLVFDLLKENNTSSTYKSSIEDVYNKWHFGIFANNKMPDLSNLKDDEYYCIYDVDKIGGGSWFKNRIDKNEYKNIISYIEKKENNDKIIKYYKGSDIKFFLNYIIKNETNHKKEEIKNQYLRQMNEETGFVQYTKIKDCFYSGEKNVYEVLFESGETITTSLDHLYKTDRGWKKLKELITLSDQNNIVVNEGFNIAVNELETYKKPYKNKEILKESRWNQKKIFREAGSTLNDFRHTIKEFSLKEEKNNLKEDLINAVVDEESIKDFNNKLNIKKSVLIKYSPIKSVKYIGKKKTYDIEVEGPFHNFSCEGVIVHNSFNEASGRYKQFNWETYSPEEWRLQDTKNKQGSSEIIEFADDDIKKSYEVSKSVYEKTLEEGIAREQARIVMPVGQYTEFFATVNLRNLFHFLELRLHSHAQYEIKVYAEAILKILRALGDLKWSVEIFEEMKELKELFQELSNENKKDLNLLKEKLQQQKKS